MNDENENPQGPGGPFDPRAALAELAGDTFTRYARKLSFSERCGLAYALRTVSHETVRQAFNLSRATVSQLAQALKPGRGHYTDVWREWELMSEEAFVAKHYTRELHFRLKRVDQGLTHLPGAELDIAPKLGGDPRATKYAYWRYGVITLPDGSRWRIDWGPMRHDPNRDLGWWFTRAGPDDEKGTCLPEGQPFGAESLLGLVEQKPFRTSADTLDGLYELNGYSDQNPRPKPGRPKIK
jgi:hypothetical protein